MMWILAASLWLQPVLDAPGELRLASTGTGDGPVAWTLDGRSVAATWDGHAVHIAVEAGSHDLWAQTEHEGPWTVLARPTTPVGDGASYTDGWSASDEGEDGPAEVRPASSPGSSPVPALLAAAGIGLLLGGPRRSKPS